MLNIRQILHPTDLSSNARHAFEVACDFAENYNARLIVVGVIERPSMGAFAGFGSEVRAARREMQQALDEMKPTDRNVCIERRVVEGISVAKEILRVAKEENCDLIVMGTHGRTGIERLAFGSVAEEVAHKAPCPVLPIRDASRLLGRATSGSDEGEKNVCTTSDVGSATAVCVRQPNVTRQVTGARPSNAVDKSGQTTNAWIVDFAKRLDWEPDERAYQAFRAVLHGLRDRLTVDQAAGLGVQLPLLIRGVFYEGWHPAGEPLKDRTKREFVAHVENDLIHHQVVDPERIITAAFGVLSKHLPGGEIEKIKAILPSEVRAMWK